MRFVTSGTPPWQPLAADAAAREHTVLTLAQWRAHRERWPAHLSTGVELPNDTEIAAIAGDLKRWQLVVLRFPKWTDGRAYSQARLLRSRHGFGGELRAAGDVVPDMAPLLHRAGFTSAQLRDGESDATAHRALAFFLAGHYQADANTPQPLFRRQPA